jgi:hypothetical protein
MNLIKVTPGGRHGWYETEHGRARKPLGRYEHKDWQGEPAPLVEKEDNKTMEILVWALIIILTILFWVGVIWLALPLFGGSKSLYA